MIRLLWGVSWTLFLWAEVVGFWIWFVKDFRVLESHDRSLKRCRDATRSRPKNYSIFWHLVKTVSTLNSRSEIDITTSDTYFPACLCNKLVPADHQGFFCVRFSLNKCETSLLCVQKSALLSMDLKSVWALIQSRGFYSLVTRCLHCVKGVKYAPHALPTWTYSKETGVRLRKQFPYLHEEKTECNNSRNNHIGKVKVQSKNSIKRHSFNYDSSYWE